MAVVRGELNIDDIRRASVAIAAIDGLGGVSMRKVADAIGVWPTAVYHHVGDKDGLVQLVLAGVLDELSIPDPKLPWDEWLRAFAAATREVLLRYPGVATHLSEVGNPSRPALELMDCALGVLGRGGFDARDAVLVFVDFFGFVLSRIRREETIATPPARNRLSRTLDTAHDSGWGLPHIEACRVPLAELTPEEYMNAGVEMLIRGAEQLRRSGPMPSCQP